jgi:transcriptional regulator with XRE-family HTH domain
MKLRGLRQARQRLGISIGQLAETTGLRRETITHLEHGQEEPQPYALRRLVAALGVTNEELVGTATPVTTWEGEPAGRVAVLAERR